MPEGLKVFDTIVGVNGKAVNRQEHITDVIRTKKPGDTVDLIVIRDLLFKNVTVTLKKLEVTGAQLYDKKEQLKPKEPEPEKPDNETPKEEKPNEKPKTDNETTPRR